MNYVNYMKALSAAIAIAGFCAAPALAQDMPPTQEQMPPPATSATPSTQAAFLQVDANHDAAISKDEASADAQLGAAFDGLDADHNGSLDQAEFGKYAQGSQQQGTSDDDGTPTTPAPGTY